MENCERSVWYSSLFITVFLENLRVTIKGGRDKICTFYTVIGINYFFNFYLLVTCDRLN